MAGPPQKASWRLDLASTRIAAALRSSPNLGLVLLARGRRSGGRSWGHRVSRADRGGAPALLRRRRAPAGRRWRSLRDPPASRRAGRGDPPGAPVRVGGAWPRCARGAVRGTTRRRSHSRARSDREGARECDLHRERGLRRPRGTHRPDRQLGRERDRQCARPARRLGPGAAGVRRGGRYRRHVQRADCGRAVRDGGDPRQLHRRARSG